MSPLASSSYLPALPVSNNARLSRDARLSLYTRSIEYVRGLNICTFESFDVSHETHVTSIVRKLGNDSNFMLDLVSLDIPPQKDKGNRAVALVPEKFEAFYWNMYGLWQQESGDQNSATTTGRTPH